MGVAASRKLGADTLKERNNGMSECHRCAMCDELMGRVHDQVIQQRSGSTPALEGYGAYGTLGAKNGALAGRIRDLE